MTPDGPVWGVKARVLPKGEYDAEDEQVDGVQEEGEEMDQSWSACFVVVLQCLLEKILGKSFWYGGSGMDVAFPNTVYQQLHRMTRAMCGNAGGRQPWCLPGRS